MTKVRIERGRENLGDVLVATKSMDIGTEGHKQARRNA